MKKKDLEHFKKLLLSSREKILEQLNFDKEQLQDLFKKEIGDIVDKAFYQYEKNRTLDISEKEKEKLRAIGRALIRIEKKSYGKCFVCKEEIDKKRLEAIPWTLTCLEHASKMAGKPI